MIREAQPTSGFTEIASTEKLGDVVDYYDLLNISVTPYIFIYLPCRANAYSVCQIKVTHRALCWRRGCNRTFLDRPGIVNRGGAYKILRIWNSGR